MPPSPNRRTPAAAKLAEAMENAERAACRFKKGDEVFEVVTGRRGDIAEVTSRYGVWVHWRSWPYHKVMPYCAGLLELFPPADPSYMERLQQHDNARTFAREYLGEWTIPNHEPT